MKLNLVAKRSILALLTVSACVAQQPTLNYYRVDFLKAKPGKLSEYEDFLKKNVTALSQTAIKEGKLLSWGYTRVVTPAGTSVNHDLIGFYAFDKWEQLEPTDSTPDSVKAVYKTLGFTSPGDYTAKRDTLRDMVRSEIWHRAASTTMNPSDPPKPGEYVVVSYLKSAPGKSAEYIDIWKKYSLPLQEERVKMGQLKSYSMWTVGGSGGASQYDLVSLVRYAAFKDIQLPEGAAAASDAVADRIHAGKDWRQMRRDMTSLRTPVRSEIVKIRVRVP